MTEFASKIISVERAMELAREHQRGGRAGEAAALYAQVLAAQPANAEARNNLGIALSDLGRLEDAEKEYRAALALRPGYAMAANNLAVLLTRTGRSAESVGWLQTVIETAPQIPEAHNNLGVTLAELGEFDLAERSYRTALGLRPDHADALNNLGTTLRSQGRIEEAERCYRASIAARSGVAGVHSNLLYTLHCLPGVDAARLLDEHRAFDARFCAGHAPAPHANTRLRERRLRVGYVSADFRDHSVAIFLEPVLRSHARDRVEVFCYYNYPRADAVTLRLKALSDQWREIHALDDAQAEALVRRDRIDILVDLGGHSAHNRMPLFGRKPAPLQASWLGYPGTTGLSAIDARITDAIADPPGAADREYVERLIRLPDAAWCFAPGSGRVTAREASGAAGLVFGSFNHRAKINTEVVAAWARLLVRLPGSSLVATGIPAGSSQAALREALARQGVGAGRIELHERLQREDFLASLSGVDIALDTFPYNGTTTTCDLLLHGIPVVTLRGATSAARCGASLLARVGLEALVASTPEDYVEVASALARDADRLAGLRASLPGRMRGSPLGDAARFTRALEDVYRALWRNWCARA